MKKKDLTMKMLDSTRQNGDTSEDLPSKIGIQPVEANIFKKGKSLLTSSQHI
jgi:hypothetical protein